VEQILEASSELLAEGGVDALTTGSLAERTGIPVATIYRYFDNRNAIIAAYVDHELEAIEESVTSALLTLDRVTFRSMAETIALAHLRHHQAHPEGVPVWFGGRLNAAVVGRVSALVQRLAASLLSLVEGSGMTVGVPDFVAELVVRLADRTFEFVFMVQRTAEEQEEIVLTFIDMVATYVERFATSAGVEGLSAQEFALALAQSPAARQPPDPDDQAGSQAD
jgi:AcrR family transcriptional regulator